MQAIFSGTERYRVIRKLGEGGMGVVYEVQDTQRGERVALKTLRNPDPEKIYRLKREFRALANLNDPNLISLYELVVSDDVCFFTMELVDGVRIINYVRGASASSGDTGESSIDRRTTDSQGTTPSSSGSPVNYPELEAVHQSSVEPGQTQTEAVPCFNEPRLRSALYQLTRGLVRLHSTGRVHRDIKPSNIRVTGEGHLILLDFGLVAEVDDPQASAHGKAVGTGIYMAPEQGFGESPTPAADWYSVGIILYEALTGRPPFRGSLTKIVLNKQQALPTPPRELAPGIPPDLDRLCMELLAIQPEDRPSGDLILQRLATSRTPASLDPARKRAAKVTRAAPFTGRRSELAQLVRALSSAAAGQSHVVLLSGSSGVGKTMLVRQLLDQERIQRSDMVVLQGRCYDSESVSFQAIDSLVDNLSRFWRRLPAHQAERMLPDDAALLTRLFPVLGRVPAVAGSPPIQTMADHQEMRTRAVAALQETLHRLVRNRLLVLFLDDMQWAGTNTLRLLTDLMREPAPPSLLILSTRPEGCDRLQRLMPAAEPLQLDALSDESAQELARHLLRPGMADLALQVAAEAAGNPFFIIELAQYVQSGEHTTLDSIRLEDLLSQQIQELGEAARRVLEIVALAGAHIKTPTLSRATGLAKTQLARELRELRTMKLIRMSGIHSSDRVEPFHDRIREATLESLADSSRREHHRALALALSGKGSEEQLSFHWRGAGEHDRAAEHAQTAAAEAMARLDFDRAANLYRMTLGLGSYTADQERAIMMTLGEALSNAGRPAEAAEVLTAAADGAEPSLRLELQRRSVDELLRGGYVEEGLHASIDLLKQIGMRFARTPWHTLLSIVVRRSWLRIRGLRWHERPVSEIPPSTLNRIDVCWSLSVGLAAVDTIRSADFQMRALLMALRAGEPLRIARSLVGESILNACQGSGRARLLQALSAKVSKRLGDPYLLAFQHFLKAYLAYYLDNDWRASLNHLIKTEQLYRAHKGKGWEVDSAQLWIHFNRIYLGELRDLSQSIPSTIHEAEQRGDLYLAVSLRTRANLVWLIGDDAEEARRQLDIAAQSWMPVSETFQLQHFFVLLAGCEIALYSGMSTEAEERLARARNPLRRSLLLSVPMILLETTFLEARILLAQGAAWPTSHLQTALRTVRRMIKKIRRIRVPLAKGVASLLEAGAAKLAGDSVDCETYLCQAIAELEGLETMLLANAARRRLGEQIGGRQGAALISTVDSWMSDQGVKCPIRMTALLVPGWPYPE